MHQIRTFVVLATLVTVGLLSTASCDPTVDVLQPSDRYRYSLFGALNVAADTQVIRVDKLGSSTQVDAAPDFDANVVLRDRSSGEEIPLRDSLTTVVTDSIRMRNFWTTHPIRPGVTYQVAVRKGGTDVTTATTTTPANPPDLSVKSPIYLRCVECPFEDRQRAENTYEVVVRNVESVAAPKVYYPLLNPEGEDTLRTWPSRDHYDDVTELEGQFNISVYYLPELRGLNPLSLTASNCPPRWLFSVRGRGWWWRPGGRGGRPGGAPRSTISPATGIRTSRGDTASLGACIRIRFECPSGHVPEGLQSLPEIARSPVVPSIVGGLA